ncbi:MAG: hypothetical protein ICV75_00770 [Nitrospiraceae bacterium]|nr:hypothetical protein [Nitrospiraceae bacterium]
MGIGTFHFAWAYRRLNSGIRVGYIGMRGENLTDASLSRNDSQESRASSDTVWEIVRLWP